MGLIKRLFEVKVDLRVRDGDRVLFIDAFIGNKKIGELRALYKYKKVILADIIINKHNVNRGVGTKLITEFERICNQKGIKEITGNLAYTDLDHKERLIHFYQKHNYEIIYENEDHSFWGKIKKII